MDVNHVVCFYILNVDCCSNVLIAKIYSEVVF